MVQSLSQTIAFLSLRYLCNGVPSEMITIPTRSPIPRQIMTTFNVQCCLMHVDSSSSQQQESHHSLRRNTSNFFLRIMSSHQKTSWVLSGWYWGKAGLYSEHASFTERKCCSNSMSSGGISKIIPQKSWQRSPRRVPSSRPILREFALNSCCKKQRHICS